MGVSLNLHDFGFFSLKLGLDFVGKLLSQVIDVLFGAFFDIVGKFCGFNFFAGIFADVTDFNFCVFDFFRS